MVPASYCTIHTTGGSDFFAFVRSCVRTLLYSVVKQQALPVLPVKVLAFNSDQSVHEHGTVPGTYCTVHIETKPRHPDKDGIPYSTVYLYQYNVPTYSTGTYYLETTLDLVEQQTDRQNNQLLSNF